MGLFDIFKKDSKTATDTFDENAFRETSSYNDETPGYDSQSYPDCPSCGTTMGYSYVLDEFKCPSCGYVMDGDDYDGYDIYDNNGMPWACSTCGGPWPDCVDSCKLYDEN